MDDELPLKSYSPTHETRVPPYGQEAVNKGYLENSDDFGDLEATIGMKKHEESNNSAPNPKRPSKSAPKRIDYVLVHEEKDPETLDSDDKKQYECRQELRAKFEKCLQAEGVQIQRDSVDKMRYLKLHATFDRLCREAQVMKLELPLAGCEIYDDGPGNCWTRFEEKHFVTDDEVEPVYSHHPSHLDYVSAPFQRDLIHIYQGWQDEDTFFRPGLRSLLLHHILINMDIRDKENLETEDNPLARKGLPYLIHKGAYKQSFILHCQTADDPSEQEEIEFQLAMQGEKMNEVEKMKRKENTLSVADPRKELNDTWTRFFKYQPLWKIRNYFGEKIALYFAWSGVLITTLWIPTLFGIAVFIYGVVLSASNNADSGSTSSVNSSLIEEATDVMTESLNIVKLAFDNPATPFFALVICLWGTIFLEIWKRNNATLAYEWDVDNFEDTEPDRPEFYGVKKMQDPVTLEDTWYYPLKRQLIKFSTSFSVLVIMVFMVFISVAAVILYRVIVSIDYCKDMGAVPCLLLTTVVSSVLNAVSIMILGKFYEILAIKLTDWENHRTQTQYDDALIIKLFAFQFANCYTSLFYIAFFRGYEWTNGLFGLGDEYQDTCGTIEYVAVNGTDTMEAVVVDSNCMAMLSFQVLTVMIIKPMPKFAKDVIIPWLLKKWRMRNWCRKGSKVDTTGGRVKPMPYLEREYNKPQLGNFTLGEYTEKVIMYGYLMLFAASFSLAPLIVMIVFLADIRVDARRMLWLNRRPVPLIAQDIGMWYNILQLLNICGVITNGFLIAYTSEWGHDFDEVGKLWVVLIFEEKYQISKIVDLAIEEKYGIFSGKTTKGAAVNDVPLMSGSSPLKAARQHSGGNGLVTDPGTDEKPKKRSKKKKKRSSEEDNRMGFSNDLYDNPPPELRPVKPPTYSPPSETSGGALGSKARTVPQSVSAFQGVSLEDPEHLAAEMGPLRYDDYAGLSLNEDEFEEPDHHGRSRKKKQHSVRVALPSDFADQDC